MHPNYKSYLYNQAAAGTFPASAYNTFNAPYTGRVSAPADYEQRVPSVVAGPAATSQHRNYSYDYSGFPLAAAPTGAYQKHPKSYLSSTMISIQKNVAASYAGAPVAQENPYKQRHSFDNIAPKFMDNKSLQKINCFPKQRFTPYTGRSMASAAPVPNPATNYPVAPEASKSVVPQSVQQVVPVLSQLPASTALNSSVSHLSSHSSSGLNASASSFNNSTKSDLDTSSTAGDAVGKGDISSSSTANISAGSSSGPFNANGSRNNDSGIGIGMGLDLQKKVMLQLNNLDSSYEEIALKKFLISLLKPITPIVSLVIDGVSSAKIEVPSPHFAKSVISQLHRKKIGRKRMLVSYCKETINDISTLGYQVAGLLKDVPFYTLPLNKFRELFQARFKASISVLELYKMVDVCHIRTDENEEKHIHLNQAFLAKIEESPFNPSLQHSIPYCARHFKRENFKGWAEQELEPLPYVFLTISHVQNIVYRLMHTHLDGIPVASILHCIEACLNITIRANENGISLEHLLSCAKGIQIENNVYGIKIIGLKKTGPESSPPAADIYDAGDALFYSYNCTLTPAQALAKEVIELLKICPKATMNFSKFVPAYHNYFGKQCRVADYGYTKLIELFEGMSSIIQVLGEGNSRHITLTHRIQIRRFSNDLMRTLKWQVNKSILLSKLPHLMAFTLNHTFSITDYGVCSLADMLSELEANGVITLERIVVGSGHDTLISLPKHKQSRHEIDKTFIFSGEVVELLRNMPHYEILFQKFGKSYFYHFGYHCRLSDYGFQKLAELFETVEGLITLDPSNDENRKLNLAPVVARRVFAEQLNEIVSLYSRRKGIRVPLVDAMSLFRNKFGYSMIPQTLGCHTIDEMMRCLPFIEINESEKDFFIICHSTDEEFRKKALMVCLLFMHLGTDSIIYTEFFPLFYQKFNEYLTESYILAMKHVLEVRVSNGIQVIVLTELIKFMLWTVCRLDAKTATTMKSLRSHLNIQINGCFPLGFANLSSLLAAFPEIFLVQGRPHENSEVLLQPQFFISKPEIQKFFHALKQQADQQVPGNAVVPLSYVNQQMYLPTEPTLDLLGRLGEVDFVPRFNAHDDPMMSIYSQQVDVRRQSSNSAKTFAERSLTPIATVLPPTDSSKVISKWIRGVKRDFIPLTIPLYEPPKPDTPPSKTWPFGFDPIWSEEMCSPPIDVTQLKLPPISPAIFPVLSTPEHLKISSYTLFDFDAAYRDAFSISSAATEQAATQSH